MIPQPKTVGPKPTPNVQPSSRPTSGIQQQQQPQRQPINPASVVSPTKRAQSKELTILTERQSLFKQAALKAKQEGNVEVALAYLRNAKV